jgi:hypothetical protein
MSQEYTLNWSLIVTVRVFRSGNPRKAVQCTGRSSHERWGVLWLVIVCFQWEQMSQVQLQSILPCTVQLKSFDSWSHIGVNYSLFSISCINILFYCLFLFAVFILCLFIFVHVSFSFNMQLTWSKLSGKVLHSQSREIVSDVYKYMKEEVLNLGLPLPFRHPIKKDLGNLH